MKLNLKFAGRELLFTTIMVLFLWGSFRIMNVSKRLATQDYNVIPIMLVMFTVSVLFGILTGIPMLWERWNSSGRFSWPRFIIQGIPALLLSAPYFFISYFFHISLNSLFWVKLQIYSHNGFIIYLAGVWFWRVLVDCIKGVHQVE